MAGKTTFFVANQANLEDVPDEKLKQLQEERKSVDEYNKLLAANIKSLPTCARHAFDAFFAVSTPHIQSWRISKRRPRTEHC